MVKTSIQLKEVRSDDRALDSPELYRDRELSLLAFQERVLEEAQNPANPLLERVKFLAIFGGNLDEFFMVRVAAMHQKGARARLEAIARESARLFGIAYDCLHQDLLPALEREGILIARYESLSESERASLDRFFSQTVFPILTPLAHDPGRPFPHISGLSLNLAVVLQDRSGAERFARVKIPDTIEHLIPLPSAPGAPLRFVWLEEIVIANLGSLFPGTRIVDAYTFRITRDAEVAIEEFESDNLLETIEEAVWQRRFRHTVRLETTRHFPASVMAILASKLNVREDHVFQVPGPLDLRRLFQLHSIDRPALKFSPFVPTTLRVNSKEDLFGIIRRQDLLLHHPYDSFPPVMDFIRAAAVDPQVLAIKMTLYRVGRNSPIVESLLKAVEERKQVSVLVELKARFDEESNIEWAKALEADGVHVVYGLPGLKVHSKVALVVRREGDEMRKYVHLGTGNYNPSTARLYTDFSLLTCDEQIGNDAITLFNSLTGYAEDPPYSRLLVAPLNMRESLVAKIKHEMEFARRGETASISAKMNSLEDPEMIRCLYEASRAGVKIDLLVRGVCCLLPGLPGVSENIRVRSILGRFLEHSRIYCFHNGGNEEILLGSADLMTRNLTRRVEVLFPVTDERLKTRLRHLLAVYWSNKANARDMQPDGTYVRPPRDASDAPIESQLRAVRD